MATSSLAPTCVLSSILSALSLTRTLKRLFSSFVQPLRVYNDPACRKINRKLLLCVFKWKNLHLVGYEWQSYIAQRQQRSAKNIHWAKVKSYQAFSWERFGIQYKSGQIIQIYLPTNNKKFLSKLLVYRFAFLRLFVIKYQKIIQIQAILISKYRKATLHNRKFHLNKVR